MSVSSRVLLALIIICSLRKGLGAANLIDPPSGSVIANLEGTINATTLTCNVTNEGFQILTFWSVANFQGIAGTRTVNSLNQDLFLIGGGSFLNQLTITNWTSEVDRVTVFCGVGSDLEQANVLLRIYRPPTLRDNFLVKIQEDDLDVPVNLAQDPVAFPEPSRFEWLKDGEPLRESAGLDTTYSSVTFSSIMQSDTGNYTVTATNFLLDNATQPVGSDTGSFCLDVLYPPSLVTQGPTERYVLLGDPLSLVCGTGLDSNPQATITWTDPNGRTVINNARYTLDNGPEIVRLNFTNTIMGDNGVWMCEVVVTSERYIVSGGQLIVQDSALIGSITQHIQLTLIATPDPPSVPAVENIGATWARICWDAPLVVDSPISRYQIIAREVGGQGIVTENTTTNATVFNITGLLPATTYSFTVVAISEGGDVIAVSQEGPAIEDMTGFTVPEVRCFDPVSANGVIMVQWTYVHTGGLNITDLSAVYSYVDGTSTVVEPVMISGLDVTSVNESGLVTGFEYTFNITAENSNGSSTVSCRPTPHIIGVPRNPQFGDNIASGPGIGEVTLEIKTVASGVDNPDQDFQFIITPELDGNTLSPMPFDFPNYRSGELQTIPVRGLEPGRSYIFSATAMNIFGMSGSANSRSVRAGGTDISPPPNTNTPSSSNPSVSGDNNIGAAVGGAVGGIVAVVVIVAIVIVIIAILLVFVRRSGGDYRPTKAEAVRYEKAPTSDNATNVQEVTIDIGEDMGGKRKEDTEIQYAELETFRPPSQQKNGGAAKETKPVEPEEPVEYAVITTFKKKENEAAPAVIETSAVPDPTPDTATNEGDTDKTGTSTTLV